jgi:predicted  nucleic acid-binding Zn-ribbon protein
MAGPGPVLKESHRLLRHIQDLETRTAQAPRQLQLHKAKLQAAEDALKAAQDEIKHLKVKIHDFEVSIKSAFQQIDKWEKQREKIENKKEYDALNTEIAQARQRNAKYEEDTFPTMSLVEEKAAQLPEVEKRTQAVRTDIANFQKDYEQRLASLGQQRDTAKAELVEVEKQLPEDILPTYRKMVDAQGPDALAGVDNRICTACYTEVTPQMGMNINRGLFVLCKSCGRMLYA